MSAVSSASHAVIICRPIADIVIGCRSLGVAQVDGCLSSPSSPLAILPYMTNRQYPPATPTVRLVIVTTSRGRAATRRRARLRRACFDFVGMPHACMPRHALVSRDARGTFRSIFRTRARARVTLARVRTSNKLNYCIRTSCFEGAKSPTNSRGTLRSRIRESQNSRLRKIAVKNQSILKIITDSQSSSPIC